MALALRQTINILPIAPLVGAYLLHGANLRCAMSLAFQHLPQNPRAPSPWTLSHAACQDKQSNDVNWIFTTPNAKAPSGSGLPALNIPPPCE